MAGTKRVYRWATEEQRRIANTERARLWRVNNREKYLAQKKARYAKDPKKFLEWRRNNPEAAKAIDRRFREKHKDRRREYRLARYQANPEKYRLAAKLWRQNNPEKAKERDRKAKRLPEPTRPRPEFCECCGGPPNLGKKALALDHCHTTGKFRGWLCASCNLAVGLMDDSPEKLRQAIAYLEENQSTDLLREAGAL